MVIDISHNPRLSQLLGRIEEIRRALLKVAPDSPERQRFEQSLAGFYVEVGKYVHWMMRQDPKALARVEAEARRWAAEMDAYLAGQRQERPSESQQTSQIEVEPIDVTSDEASVVEWTQDSSLRSGDDEALSPLPEVEPDGVVDEGTLGTVASVEMVEGDLEEGPAEVEVEPVEIEPDQVEPVEVEPVEVEPVEGESMAVEVERREVEEAGLSEPVREAAWSDEAWSDPLRVLVEQLGEPASHLDESGACEAEKRRVVQATTNMETRWIVFPDAIQHALLGTVSSRARAVQERMAVDVELRLALGRMRRFREARGLDPVASLEDDGMPMGADWVADAHHWWSALLEAS